jgi:hypothetical protein
MKKLVLLAVLAIGLNTQLFGFATIVNLVQGGDKISFTSNVQGVVVHLDGVAVGTMSNGTYSYKLNRTGAPRSFKFTKAGYVDQYVTIHTKFNHMFWGNLLTGGSLGSSTDSWSTNNTKQYSPNQFYIAMNPVE